MAQPKAPTFTDEMVNSLVNMALASPKDFKVFAATLPEDVLETIIELVENKSETDSYTETFEPQLRKDFDANLATATHKTLFGLGEVLTQIATETEERRGGGNSKVYRIRNIKTPAGLLSIQVKPE